MKLFLLLTITLSTCFANEIQNPIEKDKFFGKTFSSNLPTKEQIKKPLVKKDQCIKVIKDDEAFWNNNETPVFKVEDIGLTHIKLRQFIFLKKQKEKWTEDEAAIAIPFENQDQFEIAECPSAETKLADEKVELYKKK
jgi:hypothetical protein